VLVWSYQETNEEDTMSRSSYHDTPQVQVGDVRRYGYQSDVYQRRYRVIADLGGGVFEVELLEIEDDKLELMISHTDNPGVYGWTEADVLQEIAKTGERRQMRFVSQATYDAAF
jgi:hypothetical protein